ncbi:hypothetical protein HPB50_001661 [Hyalomma asiaticum]|uniref:Uncharacterized protein n=1 Tax=Hyalomma asiaticum TaxID=266040 RepID=A0ACB7RZV4_HYAAI|nr:hypothetical protein HPB50_001661 [Hyalomma asiaticum]
MHRHIHRITVRTARFPEELRNIAPQQSRLKIIEGNRSPAASVAAMARASFHAALLAGGGGGGFNPASKSRWHAPRPFVTLGRSTNNLMFRIPPRSSSGHSATHVAGSFVV